jgi:hypothetical protein
LLRVWFMSSIARCSDETHPVLRVPLWARYLVPALLTSILVSGGTSVVSEVGIVVRSVSGFGSEVNGEGTVVAISLRRVSHLRSLPCATTPEGAFRGSGEGEDP